MLGWRLFARAVTLVTDNIGAALRVSLIPYGVFALIVALVGEPTAGFDLGAVAPEEPVVDGAGEVVSPDGIPAPVGNPVTALLGLLLYLFVMLWVAVAWHRFALLDEVPGGWLPAVKGERLLGYLWRSFVIGLFAITAIVLANLLLGTLLLPLLGAGAGLNAMFAAVSFFVGMVIFYRLAPVLPARAVDRPMTYGDALRATSGHVQTVMILALLTAALSLGLQLPVFLEGARGAVTVVYELVVGWISLMVGAGVLTVLYGHLVEGRPV